MRKIINYEKLTQEISKRQAKSWHNAQSDDPNEYSTIYDTFALLKNSGYDYGIGYQGDLFRIHSPHTTLKEYVDLDKENIIGEICDDGSCSVLPKTCYNNNIASFSKTYDFTKPVFYKIFEDGIYNFIHVHTKDIYGIDVNKIVNNPLYTDEEEVLFPISKEYLVKEYKQITPKHFKELMDNYFKNDEQ